jgi:hydrogenase maturation protease
LTDRSRNLAAGFCPWGFDRPPSGFGQDRPSGGCPTRLFGYSIGMSDRIHLRPVLILGIGNILLGDEGIGVRVIEAMRSLPLPEDVELGDGGTGGADLVEIMSHRRKVIVVDAMAADREPGQIMRLSPEDLAPSPGASVSLHEFGLLEALTMAGRLGCAPAEVLIIGVQPKEIRWATELSPDLAACIPSIIDQVLAELRRG